MLCRIYQSYYLPEQQQVLDPAFVALPNISNFLPELREYPLIQAVHDRCQWDQVPVYGMFSWQWSRKWPGMTGQAVHDWIQQQPKADAYFFNPWGHDTHMIYNLWEQGEWCHPGMIGVLEWLFEQWQMDPDWIRRPQARDHMTWCNFIVAGAEFWNRWLHLVRRYLQVRPCMPDHLRQAHDHTVYGPAQLSLFPFIVERVASLIAQTSPDLVIRTCHCERNGSAAGHVVQARAQAQAQGGRQWQQWQQARAAHLKQYSRVYPNVQDLAQEWIDSGRQVID
jgi:hypothetical protein